MRRKIFSWILFIILLCAWSPWITRETATRLAETQFNKAWEGIIDGCGTSGEESGVKDFQQIPFGATVILAYQCGLVAPGEPALHTTVYVSCFGLALDILHRSQD
jgi:hypothetical protein